MNQTHPGSSIDPDLDEHDEIVDGQRVLKPRLNTFATILASALTCELGVYARAQNLGRVVAFGRFILTDTGDLQRRPDVAFISYERWSRGRKVNSEEGWDVIPDLAIEVVSRSNTAEEVMKKIGEYFKANVRRVWVVYPIDRLIYVYESPKKLVILGIEDELDGADILPGFRLTLAELFEDAAEA
jgi:Uma2 family endonuclease